MTHVTTEIINLQKSFLSPRDRRSGGILFLSCLSFPYYTPRERGSGGYIEITLSVCLSVCPSVRLSVCLSVRLSVQIRVRPITFLWFDIDLPYLAHGCITMRRCVAFIHDPDTTLNFDLKVKFKGFCHVFMYDL